MTLIVYYLIFMIAGDFAAYFLGLLVEYELGLTGEPDRLPGPLFPFSLGVLGARDVGDQTKSGHTKCVLAGRRRQTKAWYATYEAAETAGIGKTMRPVRSRCMTAQRVSTRLSSCRS